jgi:hypothetical protein
MKRLRKLKQLLISDFAILDNPLKTIQMSDCFWAGGTGGMGQHIDSRTDYTGVIMTVSLLAKAILHMQVPAPTAMPTTSTTTATTLSVRRLT